MKTGKRKLKITIIAVLCLLTGIFCVSAYMAASEWFAARCSAEDFANLRERLERPAETFSMDDEPVFLEVAEKEDLLERYAALHAENADFYGWLSIAGTNIDYPVMYTPDHPEYYLRRAFDGSYSVDGVPFLDGACRDGCGNFIIYGHHTSNDTMFTELVKYADQSFWQAHPVIRFDTLNEIAEYEVTGAFYGKIYYTDDEDVFRYYQYTDVSDPDVFAEYVTQVRAASLYSTGVEAVPGDQLITLSTCDYHTDNGRFIVVARKIQKE